MESYFDVMAQHPNCLLAVDATDGGKWKSNFHVPQLINFKTLKLKTWTNFNANFNTDSGIKYTDDFEFEIDFEWNLTPEEFINNNKAMSVFYGGGSFVISSSIILLALCLAAVPQQSFAVSPPPIIITFLSFKS